MPDFLHVWWRLVSSWWDRRTETEHDLWKGFLGLLLLASAISVGIYLAWPRFQLWQRSRALAEAREFSARKDYRNALVAFHRVIEKSPMDIESWKQVADFLGEIGSPEVLVARRNLVWLAPDDISLRLGFVLDALRFGDVEGARKVFTEMREAAREEVGFYRIAAALAYAMGRTEEFESNLMELVRREPADHEAALDLATLRLWGADAARAAGAEGTMVRLLQHRDVRVRAAVELLKHVGRAGKRAEADVLVARLHGIFTGRPVPMLAEMPEQAMTEPLGWVALIEALKRDAAASANDAAVLARWLAMVGQPREALIWLDGLAERVRRSPLVGAAALELSLILDDEERLRALLCDGAWGRASTETIDLAFAARWQRHMGKLENARNTWADAVTAAGESLPALRILARIAVAWKDPEGAQTAMTAVIKLFPTERWAWEALRIEYARKNDTPKLLALYDKWVVSPVSNRFVEQDWVFLNFLIGAPRPSVYTRAKELRDATPFDPVAELGYALALRAQRRPREALVAMEALVGADRQTPRALLWRGIILNELGRNAEARQILGSVEITRLLPEEIRLGREAFAQAAPATPGPRSPAGSRKVSPPRTPGPP